MAEREEFSLGPGDLGIKSTNEIDHIEMGENFLSSDPESLIFVKKGETEEEEEDTETEEEKKKREEKEKKKKKEIKEVVIKPKEVSEEILFNNLNKNEGEEEEEEQQEGENKVTPTKKETKPAGQADPPAGDPPAEGEENVFNSIAKELIQYGVFAPEVDEEGKPVDPEIESPEEFLAMFQYQTRKQAADSIENFLTKYGDDYKEMFKSVFVDGVKPEDYLARYTKIQSVKGLDLTQEDNQERVVRELYRSEGRSSEYIEKRITQLKNYNDLSDEATEAQRILVDKETAAIATETQTRKDEEQRKTLIRNEYINSVSKILNEKEKSKDFDGIPVDRTLAVDTYNYITQEKFQLPNKQLLTEFDKDVLDLNRPENHERKVKIAMLMQLLKKDPKLTTVGKAAVSKETSQLFNSLKKKQQKQNNPAPSKANETNNEPEKSWFSVS